MNRLRNMTLLMALCFQWRLSLANPPDPTIMEGYYALITKLHSEIEFPGDSDRFTIECEDAGELTMYFNEKCINLKMIKVNPKFRGRGLTQLFLAVAVGYARGILELNPKCISLTAHAYEKYAPPHTFYAHIGFEVARDANFMRRFYPLWGDDEGELISVWGDYTESKEQFAGRLTKWMRMFGKNGVPQSLVPEASKLETSVMTQLREEFGKSSSEIESSDVAYKRSSDVHWHNLDMRLNLTDLMRDNDHERIWLRRHLRSIQKTMASLTPEDMDASTLAKYRYHLPFMYDANSNLVPTPKDGLCTRGCGRRPTQLRYNTDHVCCGLCKDSSGHDHAKHCQVLENAYRHGLPPVNGARELWS